MKPLELALLSQLAYRRYGETEFGWALRVDKVLATHDMTLIQTFDRVDTQGYIARCDRRGCVVIAFRGTEIERGADVSTDLRWLPRMDRLGRVHTGFAIALDHVWDMIASAVRVQSAIPGTSIYLTGHSLGGSLAVIAASRLLRDHRLGGLVTFGAPPAVSPFIAAVLSRLLNGNCIRVVQADAVTMLLRLVYRSPGNRCYIRQSGRVVERAGSYIGLLDRISVTWRGILRRWNAAQRGAWPLVFEVPSFVANHSIDRYVDALEAAAHAEPS